MARGRIINNEITKDKRINDLSNDTSRLAFTWLITFADCEGRTHGDPALVKSMLFPRRTDISVEQVESFIREWSDCGLIIWYEAKGDKWISFPRFEKNQPGLRKDREAPSSIPHPPVLKEGDAPDQGRSNDGDALDQLPVKLKEKKLIKDSSPGGDAPEQKTEFQVNMERLEAVFAETRGSDPPDWDGNPKAANKRWRTPLGQIFNQCDKDLSKAEQVVKAVTAKMKREGLTFDAPDQIIKTAQSYIIDMKNHKVDASVEW